MASTIRVYKRGSRWLARRDGTTRGRSFSTQKSAYLYARDVALNNGLTITVYYPTGGIKAVINPKNRDEESNCFLTTACVKYFGLKDDCYELETLRNFRDTYLLTSGEGKLMVLNYYQIAPEIVKHLESSEDKKLLFEKVFDQIRLACEAIEIKNYTKAITIYKSAVLNLHDKFNKE
jgi:hypothetical protein